MGAHKDRLIQAAELLDMSPDDLLARLDAAPTPELREADALLATARQCAAEGLEGHALRRYRKLDELLSAGAELPQEWREGRDAPGTDDAPRMSNAPDEDGLHPFESRDPDEARRDGLSVAGCDYCGQVAADPIHDEPDREPTPAQEEAWDVREDEARGRFLG